MSHTANMEERGTEHKSCEPPMKRHCVRQLCVLDVLAVDLCRRAIFDHISMGDLLRSECVCKRWQSTVHQYIRGSRRIQSALHITSPRHPAPRLPGTRPLPVDEKEPWFYHALYKWGAAVRAAPCTAESFEEIVELCPNLREITFYGFPDRDSVRTNVAEKLRKLKRVAFRKPRSDDEDSDQVTDDDVGILLQSNPIEELTVIGSDQITGAFCQNLKTKLISLCIRNCSGLDYRHLLTVMRYLEDLTALDLSNNNEDILKNTHLLLDKMTKLEDLELSDYDEIDLGEHLKLQGRLGQLRRLILRNNRNVNDGWLKFIVQGNKLANFDVSYCKVTMAGLTLVCVFSRWMSELSVAGNDNVSDEDVETLIRLCPNLEVLNIQRCRSVSPRLVPYLARLMRRRRRRQLPALRLRVHGTAVPEDEPMMPALILDFTEAMI